MVLESHGRTTIIGSINGFIPNDSDGGYAASKFAVEGYTDSLSEELASTGVHVAIVEPGAYKSRIREKFVTQALTGEGEDEPKDHSAEHPRRDPALHPALDRPILG